MKNNILFIFFIAVFFAPLYGFGQYFGGPSSSDSLFSQDLDSMMLEVEQLESDIIAIKKQSQEQEEIEKKTEQPLLKESSFSFPSQEISNALEESDDAKASKAHSLIHPVEIDGDTVEFFQNENKVIVEGNVVISRGDAQLRCDKVEYFHDTKDALAEGHVVLTLPEGEVQGQQMTFNFETMTGDFTEAEIISLPYYGRSETIKKVDEEKIEMSKGYVTTCDLDEPHFKLRAKNIEVYPKDRVTARGLTMVLGKLPIFYWPQYTKIMEDEKPRLILTPGYDKKWGSFLLSTWRYYSTQKFKGNVHVDFREKRDIAVGLDHYYKTQYFGQGFFKTYYLNEGGTISRRWWQKQSELLTDRQRFKAQWRHNWEIDPTTRVIGQYYRLSDRTFLKDFFQREYDRDPSPDTYFLLTKNFSKSVLSFRTDKRVNRFESRVERLPEIGYRLFSQEIGSTNFYLQSKNLYSNLFYPKASPSTVNPETHRVDSDNKISYPARVGFIELSPYVGQRVTYYSNTKDPSNDGSIRTIFKTGVDLTTKFYKTFDLSGEFLGQEINQIRHVVTPRVSYVYMNEPSLTSDQIFQFDQSIDGIEREHKVVFALDNRFQIKRDEKTVDLLFVRAESDFFLKEDAGPAGFNTIKTDLEFRPARWLTFFSDSKYSIHSDHLISANQEIQINSKEKDRWTISLGKRYHRDYNDLLTAGLSYRLNSKWKLEVYERFDIDRRRFEEHHYTLTRDLHCWEMDISFNHTRDRGNAIWVVFRMKAFPEMAFDLFKTSFNRRTVGSQP